MKKLIRIEDMDSTVMTSFRQIIQEELLPIKQTLNEHTEKLDILTGEVMVLQEQTKSIYDGIGLGDSRNKREIDEISIRLAILINFVT